MAEEEPEGRDWRREGSPTFVEFAIAVILVLVIGVVAFILLGSQTSAILSQASGGI